MQEALAPSVLFADKLKSTKSYAQTLSVVHLVTVNDGYLEGVKRLLTKATRPPKPSLWDLALLVCGDIIGFTVGGCDGYGNHTFFIGIYVRCNVDLAVFMALIYLEFNDTSAVFGKETRSSRYPYRGGRDPSPNRAYSVPYGDVQSLR